MDPESLERDNDRGLDLLSERIGLLKQVRRLFPVAALCNSGAWLEAYQQALYALQATHGIRNEADSQHSILDRMVSSMTWLRQAVRRLGQAVAVRGLDRQSEA